MLQTLTTAPFVFPLLFGFRLINSALMKTHFEPDEYFQSVEVAMSVILNKKVYTWEWFFGVRSFVYVCLFMVPLKIFHTSSMYIDRLIRTYSSNGHNDGLVFMAYAPYLVKAVTACISALGDYSTIMSYKILYNVQSGVPTEIIITTLLNIGLWLYSTRSHINSFESSISIYIFYRLLSSGQCKDKNKKIISHLISVFLSVFMIYLRPTSILTISCAWMHSAYQEILSFDKAWRSKEKQVKNVLRYAHVYLQHSRIISLPNILSGICALAACILVDSLFYKEFVCSMVEFYRINMKYKVSHLFGTLPFMYVFFFLSVLLGGYTGMLVISMLSPEYNWRAIQMICPMVYLIAHGLIAHKEMRFLLPILPFLNIIIAQELKKLGSSLSDGKASGKYPQKKKSSFFSSPGNVSILKRLVFSKYVFIGNFIIGILIGLDHQNISRPIDYLRSECYFRLSRKDAPIFVLNTFTPYMLPLTTHLGHKRVITRSLDNNPNILPMIEALQRKKRFQSPEYKLRIEEHDTAKSCMVDNIMLLGPHDYHYIIINSEYTKEFEEKLPEFVKVHESVHKRIPSYESVAIYKQAFR
ncbi:hypothetical protein NERG_00979 [Nematocida ausubeli]|uniref:Mannosyltransferase n=1 Tax=Nematocida ausubeli (strain ATCC PRA-371 / ERTm2) TaxID=1913371 RepID=H8ZBN0_NEMA1|nr:hypothetical protein NERG_00979 [Nematocida ausubeli]